MGAVPVKTIWISFPRELPYYEKALGGILPADPGRKVQAGEKWAGFGLAIDILGPPPPLQRTGSDENNNSIVVKLSHSRASLLFCGDIEQAAVKDLLRHRSSELGAKVLVVPHHGGFLPDLPKLIDAVDPRVAVIQVGANAFGHPHPSTLEALHRSGVLTFRNDLQGAVIMDFDKNKLVVETMAGGKGIISNW